MLSGSSALIASHDSICRYTALADSGGGPSGFTRVLMDPVNEPQTSGLLLIETHGSSSYLPSSIFAAAQHGVLYSYQRFIHFLCNPCAGREHYTPLMDP